MIRWTRRRSGANGSRVRALAAVITSGLVIGTTGAAISIAGSPPPGGSVQWRSEVAKCVYKPTTATWKATYSGRYTVKNANALDQLDEVYYLKPKISIQQKVGGDWKDKASGEKDSLRFTYHDLPYSIERKVRTNVGQPNKLLRGLLKVKLMLVREGRVPDRKVWTEWYPVDWFTCEFPG